MRTPTTPAQPPAQAGAQPLAPGTIPITAPGPGHTNLADDNALVDTAVEQFMAAAAKHGRSTARM